MSTVSSKTITIRIPAETDYLEIVRYIVNGAAARMGFNSLDAAKIVMSVDEACLNIIKHNSGFERDSGTRVKELEIELGISPSEKLVVALRDNGIPFSPPEYGTPPVEDFFDGTADKGFGIYVMDNFMDEMAHSYKHGVGNELRLAKFLDGRPQ